MVCENNNSKIKQLYIFISFNFLIIPTTVRENRGSISLTDDGGIELRNNLNDCLSV